MRLENKNNILYLDDNRFNPIVDNTLTENTDKMVEIHTVNDLDNILQLSKKDIISNVTFFSFINDDICEFYVEENEVIFSLCKILRLENWVYPITPILYCESFKKISYFDDVRYEDGSIYIETVCAINNDKTLFETKKQFLDNILIINEKIINKNIIRKGIDFSFEHLTAGSSILQYFGKLLLEKYPVEKVSVSIHQEGLKVTMSVETPDGKKEEIEEYLNKFGMVVTNQIRPEEFAANPIQLLELETKLQAAQMEIGFQKKLLALQDKTYDINLVSMKEELSYLRKEFSLLTVKNNDNIKLILSSMIEKDKLIKKLVKAITNSENENTKELLIDLKKNDTKGYTSLQKHIDTVLIGGIVNAPSWVQFLITHFPK